MSELPPEAVVGAPAAIAALLYAIKRLFAFDLELRANRERERARYWRERGRREWAQGEAFVRISHGLEIYDTRDVTGRTPIRILRRVAARRKRKLLIAELDNLGRDFEQTPHKTEIPAWVLALLDPEDADLVRA